jgi:hypothetical protein
VEEPVAVPMGYAFTVPELYANTRNPRGRLSSPKAGLDTTHKPGIRNRAIPAPGWLFSHTAM